MTRDDAIIRITCTACQSSVNDYNSSVQIESIEDMADQTFQYYDEAMRLADENGGLFQIDALSCGYLD